MDPQILVFVLLVAGVVLIFAELFVPSGGAIAVLCACCFLGSGYFAWQAWGRSTPIYWYSYLASVAVLIPASIYGALHLLSNTRMGDRVLLAAPREDEITPYQQEQQRLAALIGVRGVALNLMAPGGLVRVGHERLHAIADSLIIESGAAVVITGVRGNSVLVTLAPAVDNASPAKGLVSAQPRPADEPTMAAGDERDGLIDPFLPDERA